MIHGELVTRGGLFAGGLPLLAVAVVLGLLVVDVARYRGALPVGGTSATASHRDDTQLWSTSELVPFDICNEAARRSG